MKSLLKIAVVEPSLIIRNGILSVLRRLSSLNIEVIEIADVTQLQSTLSWRKPDILIVDSVILGAFSLQQIKKRIRRIEMCRFAAHPCRCFYFERL